MFNVIRIRPIGRQSANYKNRPIDQLTLSWFSAVHWWLPATIYENSKCLNVDQLTTDIINCLPMVGRWSRVSIQRLFLQKMSATDDEKIYNYKWPDGHKSVRPTKKRPISAKTKTNVLSNAARIITFLSKKNRWRLIHFGNVTGIYSMLLDLV